MVLREPEHEYDFRSDVLRLSNKFEAEHGKWPNELHLGCNWQGEYEKIVERSKEFSNPDIFSLVKHWWYMGMRVFYEHWTHSVEWTGATEELKEQIENGIH